MEATLRCQAIYEPTDIDNQIYYPHTTFGPNYDIFPLPTFIRCTMLPASLEDLTFAQPGVGPLEAGGEDLADV